jgi:superfamily II DNA or RNA helicase
MNLKELDLKKFYDSDSDNILTDFYIPALSVSIEYLRLAGFFSSTSFAVSAKGISALIRNGGTMKLVTGAKFEKEDVDAIKKAYAEPETLLEDKMLHDLNHIEGKFLKDHVRALAWMVANKRLKIKVAIVLSDEGYPLDARTLESQGIFHQKVGILSDLEGNRISFSGSENESARGWQSNIEEFKVFRRWEKSEISYFEADEAKFQKFWEGLARRTKIVDLPEAIEKKLIEIAPDNIEELGLDRWVEGSMQSRKIELRDYQTKAVESWLANARKGIFEMATGTGKTIAALECLRRTFENEKRVVAVISTPFIHLSEQWVKEFDKINLSCEKIIADSSRSRWKDRLADSVMDVENGISEKLVILTTHNTFASGDFVDIIKASKKRSQEVKFFLIIDEVHGIGAPERRKGLIEDYDYRLGLSATPKRWFDLAGTDKIFSYFKDVVFSFSLKEAIDAGYLTSYFYDPRFTCLTPEEMEKYESETRKISRVYYASKDEDEKDEIYTLLCIKRQKIIRNAANKLAVFQQLLDELGQLKYCLIYCSPKQIRIVQDILNKRGIIQHKFTQREGTKPEAKFGGISERDFLIQKFSEGVYQALVSMRCLDEGVDVPPANIAIMLDNSGNPREYIQRRGRVLRKFPGKNSAIIHDIIVEPAMRSNTPKELRDIEKKIISKELQRYRDFASSSQNAEECMRKMEKVEAMYGLK